jgi:hypothetical protein
MAGLSSCREEGGEKGVGKGQLRERRGSQLCAVDDISNEAKVTLSTTAGKAGRVSPLHPPKNTHSKHTHLFLHPIEERVDVLRRTQLDWGAHLDTISPQVLVLQWGQAGCTHAC